MSPRTMSRGRIVTIALVGLVALPTLAFAWTVWDQLHVITGRLGVGGASPSGAVMVGVSGSTFTPDPRVQIDGSNTSGLSFTLGGKDSGTFRATATGLEVWTSSATRTLALQGADARFLGNLLVDGNIASKYQDVAEWVTGPPLPAGTVVVAQEANRAIASDTAYDVRVIGVVSDRPAVILGEAGPGKIAVAHSGRLRVKVLAPVAAGDLLVTSAVPGHAMRSAPADVRPGTMLGKALESLRAGHDAVLMLLTLQ